MNWLINRFKEPSTWRGLVTLAGICGMSLSPEQSDKIVTAAVALIGLIEVFRKEPAKEATNVKQEPAGGVEPQRIITPELSEEQRSALNGN